MPGLPLINVLLLGYLLGSIPFGWVIAKIAGLGDIRKIGSGNIGATNVLRTGQKGLALLTMLLDGAKGSVAVLIAAYLYPELPFLVALAGLAALLGHLFPVWLKFKGGKGVATTFGVILALAWPVGLIGMAIWMLVAFTTRYSSLAALIAIGLAPGIAFLFGRTEILWLLVVFVCFVAAKHENNIKRLIKGTEAKIG
ncbi:MAG: glycerol-3-phosphate 1-O-acyltransferase PlsY [Alphaproteobacteria bacterium]|nr:glycerol-3-phosphate 1-O-acyltransferase PlsY [Alphaproteobacteria bacterium]